MIVVRVVIALFVADHCVIVAPLVAELQGVRRGPRPSVGFAAARSRAGDGLHYRGTCSRRADTRPLAGAEHGMSDRQRSTDFRTVVCAVDFGAQSLAALRVAAGMARRGQGRLHAVCVEDPLLAAGAAASGYDSARIRQTTRAQLRRLVGRAAAHAGLAAADWSADTVLGRPASAIAAYAVRVRADLIVMGTNSRRGPAKVFFGSVTEAVLRRAPVPVLVVPGRRAARGAVDALSRTLLGAIELGAFELEDAQRLARAARRLGAPLQLLHVVRPAPSLPWLGSRLSDHERRRLLAAEERLAVLARRVGAKARVVLGHPEEAIAAVGTAGKVGAIAVVLRARPGLFGRPQGATTYRVLAGARLPILALPGAAAASPPAPSRTARGRTR